MGIVPENVPGMGNVSAAAQVDVTPMFDDVDNNYDAAITPEVAHDLKNFIRSKTQNAQS